MSQNEGNRKYEGSPEWKPQLEFFTQLSADKKYVICKTVITSIKPIRYFEKVLQGKDSLAALEKMRTESAEMESGRD